MDNPCLKLAPKIAHDAKSVDCSKKLDAKLVDRRTKQDKSFHVNKKHDYHVF